MYAIVNIAGQQYKVEKEQKLFVHRLADKEGDKVRFDEVLLIDNDKNVLVGAPVIKGAMITGKVLSHPKADKVQVFKKKKRKGYKVLNGHRQYMTEILIQEIVEKGGSKGARPKTVASPEAKADAPASKQTEKPVEKKKASPEKKASEEKKSTPAAKKASSTAKKPAAKKKTTETKAAKPTTKKPPAKAAPKKPAADDNSKE